MSLVCVRNDFSGQVKIFTQKLDTLIGQIPVKVSPCELFLNITAREERLTRLDDLQIGNIHELRVFRSIEVLLSDENSLLEEVTIDRLAVGLRNQHLAYSVKQHQSSAILSICLSYVD